VPLVSISRKKVFNIPKKPRRIESWTIACLVLSDSMWLSAAVFMINAEPNERLGVKFTFLYFECPIFGKYKHFDYWVRSGNICWLER